MARNDTSDKVTAADGLTRSDLIGGSLALGWIVVIGLLFWLTPSTAAPFDALQFVLMLVAVFMPVGLIWVAVTAARSVRLMRAESYRLQLTIDKLRRACQAEFTTQAEAIEKLEQSRAAPPAPVSDDPEPAPAPPPEKAQSVASRFASRREVSRLIVPQPAPQAPADQPSLALDTASQDERPPLSRADMIRALHFPDDENDHDGFAALRRALRDRDARKLVQAGQDVLTLLSQDGIYMDDMHTEPVGVELWRRFSKGERGPAVARIGTVRDADTLDLVKARMREDAIFRDAAHHFLRKFDLMLVTFEDQATDTDMLAMADTRTARAFVLLGRATGTFK